MLAETLLVRSPDTVLREEDRVCFHKKSGCILQLNAMGFAVLLHFEEPFNGGRVFQSLESLVNNIGEFCEPRDVEGFIVTLITLGMLVEAGMS